MADDDDKRLIQITMTLWNDGTHDICAAPKSSISGWCKRNSQKVVIIVGDRTYDLSEEKPNG